MSRGALNNSTLSSRAQSRDLSRIKLMDAGSLVFSPFAASSSSPSAPAAEGAKQWLEEYLSKKGGHVFEKDGEIWWEHSDAFHYQLITAKVEASGERFVASCKEGSAATPLLRWLAWILFLALSVASVWWLRSGWCAAIIFVLLLFTLWLVLRPAQKSVRRMLRLAEDLHP